MRSQRRRLPINIVTHDLQPFAAILRRPSVGIGRRSRAILPLRLFDSLNCAPIPVWRDSLRNAPINILRQNRQRAPVVGLFRVSGHRLDGIRCHRRASTDQVMCDSGRDAALFRLLRCRVWCKSLAHTLFNRILSAVLRCRRSALGTCFSRRQSRFLIAACIAKRFRSRVLRADARPFVKGLSARNRSIVVIGKIALSAARAFDAAREAMLKLSKERTADKVDKIVNRQRGNKP